MEQSAIVTGGNRNITLRGKGGANDNQYWPDGGIQIQGSYIKTKDGEILLEGAKGTGYNRYGITAQLFQNVDFSSDFPVFVRVQPFIGTNGALRMEGDSVAIWFGDLQIHTGRDSVILPPVVAAPDRGGYSLIKTGPGKLTFSGDARTWSELYTSATPTNGTFSDVNNTAAFDE